MAVGRDRFPRVWRLIDNLPLPDPPLVSFEDAKQKIFASTYTSKVEGLLKNEPTELRIGADVRVDSLG